MTMERTEVLEMMGELKLYGMKSAYDEALATALKRKHEPQQLVGDLLKAEISEKQARSIRYQLTTAKLPLAKDVNERHSSSGAEPRSLSCTPSRIDDRPDPKKTGRQADSASTRAIANLRERLAEVVFRPGEASRKARDISRQALGSQ